MHLLSGHSRNSSLLGPCDVVVFHGPRCYLQALSRANKGKCEVDPECQLECRNTTTSGNTQLPELCPEQRAMILSLAVLCKRHSFGFSRAEYGILRHSQPVWSPRWLPSFNMPELALCICDATHSKEQAVEL